MPTNLTTLAESKPAWSLYILLVAVLAFFCLVRVAAFFWLGPDPESSFTGLWAVVRFLSVLFIGATFVLGVFATALLLPSRFTHQSAHSIAVGVALWTLFCGRLCCYSRMANSRSTRKGLDLTHCWNPLILLGAGFGFAVASALVPLICIIGLNSRPVAGYLGIYRGRCESIEPHNNANAADVKSHAAVGVNPNNNQNGQERKYPGIFKQKDNLENF